MFHFPLPIRPQIPARRAPGYVWVSGLFSPQELDRIGTMANALPAQSTGANAPAARWLMPAQDTDWIYQKVVSAIAPLNAQHYKLDVTGLDEPLCHVTYPAGAQGLDQWRADLGDETQPARKLSFFLQLSDPRDYDGGELQTNAEGAPETCQRERGRLMLFPSRQLFRMTPVTRGACSVLAAWIVGPPLR